MRRTVSVNRLARSAGLNPDDVVLALIERGVDIDDPERTIEGATWKAARAVIREMRGGPAILKAREVDTSAEVLEPAMPSPALIGMLSVDDVLFIHDRLCHDFAQTPDPIDPPGVRSMSLLESAVNRQTSGYEGLLKYHDPILNAATLLYGICNDHPFHNGNKRTALVSGLAHLDRNRLVMKATKQREVFQLMIAVAGHSLLQQPIKLGRETHHVPRRGTPDEEVMAVADWLSTRVEKVTRGEATLTYRELRQILSNFGFSVHPLRNQKMAICRTETRGALFFKAAKPKTLMALEWPGDGREVAVGTVKHIRQTLRLCEEDGVTRDAFYTTGVRVDRFINDYRLVLRRLASR